MNPQKTKQQGWQTVVRKRKGQAAQKQQPQNNHKAKPAGGTRSIGSKSSRTRQTRPGSGPTRATKSSVPKNFVRLVASRDASASVPTYRAAPIRNISLAAAIPSSKAQEVHKKAAIREANRAAEHGLLGPGIGNPNRVGDGIDHINSYKNLNSRAENEVHKLNSRAYRNLEKVLSPDKVMCPEVRRYCELLDKPLTAPWGDEGEMPVRCPLYEDMLPPDKSVTVRAFGQQTISIQRGNIAWIVLCGGAGNISDDGPVVEQNDVLFQACPNTFHTKTGGVVQPQATLAATLGAPPDGRPIIAGASGTAVGGGAAGYWYQEDADFSNLPPSIETTNQGFVSSAAMTNWSVGDILQWGTPAPFGEMDPDDSSQYKYRPVAFGVLVTPADPNMFAGGYFDAQVIPQGTNETYVHRPVAAGSCEGASTTSADLLSLPDHRIQRADGSIQVNWLPGRQDYRFYRTDGLLTSANGVVTPVIGRTTGTNNARMIIRITPPVNQMAGENPTHSQYVISYVGFYEVAGRCIQNLGSVPRPIPNAGAQVSTATQNALNVEIDSRDSQITDGTVLQVALDHPTLAPIVEGSSTLDKAKDAIKEVLSFGEELLPFAAMLL